MHQPPKDSDIQFLIGKTVSDISVTPCVVQIRFGDGQFIAISSEGSVDGHSAKAGPELGALALALLGKTITAARVGNGGHLSVVFDTQEVTIVHDAGPYESYVIGGPEGLQIV